MRQALILGTAFFILLIFIFITYFYFYTEGLTKFSADGFSIYVEKEWIENTQLKKALTDKGYGFFTGLSFKEKLNCFTEEVASIFKKIDFIGLMYINGSHIENLINEQTRVTLENNMLKLSFFEKKSGGIIFESNNFDLTSNYSKIQQLRISTNKDEFDNNETLNFILITKENAESLKDKISNKLAIQRPVERQVVLPDGTSFIETVIDPSIFNFGSIEDSQNIVPRKIKTERYDKNIEILYLTETGNPLSLPIDKNDAYQSIIIWSEGNYSFISNDLVLSKIIINNENSCFFNIKQKNFNKAIYFKLNDFGIEDILIIQTQDNMQGCMNMESAMS